AGVIVRLYTGREATRETLQEELPLRMYWPVERALSAEPARSFSSFMAFADALCQSSPPRMRHHPDERRLPPVFHRRRSRWRRPLALALMVIALVAAFLTTRPEAPSIGPVSESSVVLVGDGELLVYSAAGLNLLGRVRVGEKVSGAAASGGVLAATLPESQRLLLFDLRAGAPVGYARMTEDPVGVIASPAMDCFLVLDDRSRLATVVQLLPRVAWRQDRNPCHTPALLPSCCGALAVTHGDPLTWSVLLADPTTGRLLSHPVWPSPGLATSRTLGPICAIASSPGGKSLFVALENSTVLRLDPTTLKTHSRFAVPGARVLRLLVSADLATLWAVQVDGRVAEVDLATGELRKSYDTGAAPTDAALSPQGIWLLSGKPCELVLLNPRRSNLRRVAVPSGVTRLIYVAGGG
ncbi:MAG: hypothetical protein AB1758_35130, partial [Candidatus Eremiobacterota bacterium]